MTVSQEQRALDLVYAGHGVSEVANLLGIAENVIKGYIRDLTQTPTSQGATTAVSTPAIVSGTPQQDTTGEASEVYVAITGHAAGTATVAIGPTNAVANTIISATDASVNRTLSFRLPAGWFFEVTVGGGAAIASAKQITG